uniref:GRIP domain-containing protein n=2 Tax=Timema TaxID=61471 RepID=A0A7R9FMG9_9NEOP|nr:unnamed protein product [Timema tahoe]
MNEVWRRRENTTGSKLNRLWNSVVVQELWGGGGGPEIDGEAYGWLAGREREGNVKVSGWTYSASHARQSPYCTDNLWRVALVNVSEWWDRDNANDPLLAAYEAVGSKYTLDDTRRSPMFPDDVSCVSGYTETSPECPARHLIIIKAAATPVAMCGSIAKGTGTAMEDRLPLNESRIPVARAQERTLRRSASVRLRGERGTQHFPAIAESTDSWTQPATHGSLALIVSILLSVCMTLTQQRSLVPMPPGRDNGSLDDDLDSLASYGSVASCDHAYFARNGTTFSGRQMKYVVHCSSHGGATMEYLTPTQRANRKIRRLSALLQQTEHDLEKKNLEIGRLTQEVVELRLGSNFAEATTKDQELSVESPDSGRHERSHASSSLGDSGLFEDLGGPHMSAVEDREGEYELRLEKLLRNHSDQTRELKERHNDKVEELLMKLTDVNNRYCELRTEHDQAQDRLLQSNKERDILRRTLEEQEERHKSMYLKMYLKGQEAARFEHADQAPERVSVPELLQQLQDARNELDSMKAMYRRLVESRANKGDLDPEITLQFLKSAVYYLLTDRENHQGHLNAIQSILGYTDTEKLNIDKAYKLYLK